MKSQTRRGRATKQRNTMIRIEGQGLDSDCQLKNGIENLRQRFLKGEIVEPVVPVLIVGTTCAWICFVNLSEKDRTLQTGNMEADTYSFTPQWQDASSNEHPNEEDTYRLRLFGSSIARLTPYMETPNFNYCVDVSHAVSISRIIDGFDKVDVRYTVNSREYETMAERIVLA